MDKQVHIGTDRQTNRICCAECAQGDYLTVCWRVCERTGGVCICLFALVCLRMCVSCVWLCFLCVLTHVCLYVPCRYHTAGAKPSKPKSDSLYSTLCDILPFIFPLWQKSKSLLSLAQLSPLEVSLAKNEAQYVWILSGDTFRYKNYLQLAFYFFILNKLCIVRSTVFMSLWVHRASSIVFFALTQRITGHLHVCACTYCKNALTHLSQQFLHSDPPTHIFLEVILSVSCCLLSLFACHRPWHLALVLPHLHQATFMEAFNVLVKNRKHRNVTWISWATTVEA